MWTYDDSVDWTVPAKMTLRTWDHPEARGRAPEDGEVGYTVRMKMDTGEYLDVQMGPKSLESIEKVAIMRNTEKALAEIGVVLP